MEKRRLNKEELNKILKIKSGMNSQRLQFNINDLPKRSLTLSRFLGFVEGMVHYVYLIWFLLFRLNSTLKMCTFYMRLRNF
jgi:hypothetical protein